jgi:hypothetical protein
VAVNRLSELQRHMQDAARDICKAISTVIVFKKGGLQPNQFSRSQMVWALCTKVGSTEKSVAMWSCVLAFRYTHLCVCFVAHCDPSLCVSTQQTQSVSMVHCIHWVYLLVVQEVVQSCSVWPNYLQREGLQSPLLIPIRGKHFVIFILRHILVGHAILFLSEVVTCVADVVFTH